MLELQICKVRLRGLIRLGQAWGEAVNKHGPDKWEDYKAAQRALNKHAGECEICQENAHLLYKERLRLNKETPEWQGPPDKSPGQMPLFSH